MIDELQRQVYLSALGIDSYMPRIHLDFAPVSIECILPELILEDNSADIKPIRLNIDPSSSAENGVDLHEFKTQLDVTPINNLINDIFDNNKSPKASLPKKDSARNDETLLGSQIIDAFSLSVWQPFNGLMIVDSRDTKLALPTETLCKNLLHFIFPNQALNIKEEVLRCPMIENSFAKRTDSDARVELQTWFSVQREIREVKYVWLLGSNASRYLIADSQSENLWRAAAIVDSAINALILPSLNELLINPHLKKSLLTALRHYHS